MKCLEENIAKTLQGIYIGKGFLKRTQITPKIIPRTDKLNCIELESLHVAKKLNTSYIHNQQNGGKIFATHISNGGGVNV